MRTETLQTCFKPLPDGKNLRMWPLHHSSIVVRDFNILTVQKDDLIASTSTENGSRRRASPHFDVLLYHEGGTYAQVEDCSIEKM